MEELLELREEAAAALGLANVNFTDAMYALDKHNTYEFLDLFEEAEADLHYMAWKFYNINTALMIVENRYDV